VVHDQQEVLEDLRTQLRELDGEIGDRDSRISQLEDMVKGKDSEMQDLVDMIHDKDRVITQMQLDHEGLEDEFARKQRENEERRRAQDELKNTSPP
jgi:chromosome segregation ATPase